MAREGSIEKNNKVKRLVNRYADKRAALKQELNKARKGELSMAEAMDIQAKLDALPTNSSKVRERNRCNINGRPRGYMRKFGINRYSFRMLASYGKLPGVTKSSW